MSVPSQATVAAGQIQHLLLERYTYAPGPVAPLAAHAHPEYQLGLSLDSHGQYRYRGANVVVPPAHVSFVNAGEAHTPNGRAAVPTATTFHLLYIDPANFAAAAAELDRPLRGLPSFPLTSSADAQLVRSLLQLLQLGEYPTTPLDHDRRLFDTLVLLLTRFAVPAVPEPPLRAARPEVERARAYLESCFADAITLHDLAAVAGLSRYHLARAFRATVGVPPHAYLIQVRLRHAKALLARGEPPAQVARATGFFDQSHLGLHFKRVIGTTPAHYGRLRKNLLDTPPLAHDTDR